MNIYQKLNEVRKKVVYLQKDAKVEGYRAITHDMVTSHVRPHFIEFGIVVIPSLVLGHIEDTGKTTSKGTPISRYVGTYDVSFVNTDEPEDRFTMRMAAIGEDHGDKGPGKAVSYATKTCLLKVLSIETGEGDESRVESAPDLIDEAQLGTINNVIATITAQKIPFDLEKFKAYLGVGSLADLTTDKYNMAIAALNSKLGK